MKKQGEAMRILSQNPAGAPASVLYRRCTIDLATGTSTQEEVPCRNLEDVLGGFGRSFQLLAERRISEAYCPENPLIMNTGILTGTNVMTGLRTYFSAYSPLKQSSKGLPAAMWSAASGKFGSKLKWTGIDEVIFENRSDAPVYAVFSEQDGSPRVELKPAGHLLGLTSHEKIMHLQKEYADAHFAVVGPGGENFSTVYMGAVALSTENQLKSGEDKCRFSGRGGMGSLMGYKNLLAVVAQSTDKLGPVTAEMRDVNRDVIKGGGSARFQPLSQGGGGGTWANLEVLQAFYAVPENNFRPKGHDAVEGLFRENVEKTLDIRTEGCFRCGIRCHNNIYRRKPDGSRGEFVAKFDFEPLNLFGTNLGIHDGGQVAELIQLCDHLSMDAISLGTTIAYVLDYNERHPEKPLFNGAGFGQFERIKELIAQTGRGELSQVGKGLKRLSEELGETSYAMQVKGLELPAYLPDTNPGYAFAIAGGHMSMGTHLLQVREGKTSVEDWAHAITQVGLLQVGYDMIGLCKFVGLGMGHEFTTRAIKTATGLEVTSEELVAAVRRAYLRGLALELRQGYQDDEYTVPSQVYQSPNPNVKLPSFVTPEFLTKLREQVWAVFKPEMAGLLPE
jgi:aldehyde:ferredoxin oxidoreductase